MSELFEYYIADDIYQLKYAKGKPSLRGREFHNYDEFVLFLDGKSQLISKNIQLSLSPGTLVLIPREQFHQFLVTEEERYQRCILGFKETPELRALIREVMSEITVIPHPSERMISIFESLIEALTGALSEEEIRLLIPAALTQLLIEQKMVIANSIRELVTVSNVTREAINYIDGHLTEELDLQSVAGVLNVSVSSLSHHFREEMNISVYHYILKKRLSIARRHIEKGVSLCNAATCSGFKDYTSFFRLYKKYYGESPSDSANSNEKKKRRK